MKEVIGDCTVEIPLSIGIYRFVRRIGRGSYSVVYKAVDESVGQQYAIKVFSQEFLVKHSYVEQFQREVTVFSQLDHKHIVKMQRMLSDDELIYLIMEYCPNSDLHSLLLKTGAIPVEDAIPMFNEILEAVAYLHEKGICHRDIKLQNILLDASFSIKIADFGFCRVVEEGSLMKTKCGSPAFIAPEVYEGEGYNGILADMWSLGVVLFCIVTGRMPWESQNTMELYSQMKSGSFTIPESVPSSVLNTIKSLLNPNPSDRPLCRQLLRPHQGHQGHRRRIERRFVTPKISRLVE